MAYDMNKDDTLYEAIVNTGTGQIRIGIYRYGDGEPKMGMVRPYQTKDGVQRASAVGRIELHELVALMPEIKMCGRKLVEYKDQMKIEPQVKAFHS